MNNLFVFSAKIYSFIRFIWTNSIRCNLAAKLKAVVARVRERCAIMFGVFNHIQAFRKLK